MGVPADHKSTISGHVPAQKDSEGNSYNQILKSSIIIGGSSVINILVGIVRTKFMAVLLGPSGVGIMGMYISIANTMNTLAGMGISSSGVRQIAEAAGTGDQIAIARTIITLRRTALALGALGALLLLAAARPISSVTFGDTTHLGAVAILSITVLFGAIAGGQTALVQGMRRINDLAKISILGAISGAALSIPVVYLFREQGIIPLLLITSASSILTSWWYARRVEVEKVEMGWSNIAAEACGLLRLG